MIICKGGMVQISSQNSDLGRELAKKRLQLAVTLNCAVGRKLGTGRIRCVTASLGTVEMLHPWERRYRLQ